MTWRQSPSIYTATPDITALDNRGLPVRLLRYCRSQAGEAAQERVEQQRYTPLGHLAARRDARFFASGGTVCNFEYQSSLNGQPLQTQSRDTGTRWQLSDIEGRPFWQRDARGTEQRFCYDTLGRLSERRETLDGGTETVRERYIYGETQADADKRNLRGQLLRHYDTAGLLESAQGFTLTGTPLQQTRRLLPVETASDWTQGDETQWQSKLEADAYTTGWQHDLNGQLLMQTDAKGHRQRLAYDVAGALRASWVQLKEGPEQAVLKALRYSAAGQKLSETAGNDVITDYRYEPETQRLLAVITTRTGLGKRKTVLQQLRYEYDPVGNITARHNDAEAIRFFKNQHITASAYYTYDSLYQLIEASGQENDRPDINHDNPAATAPLDGINLVNYTRRYQYDAGGNLNRIRHTGAQNHTRELVVSSDSNHALRQTGGITPAQVKGHFDACGNPRQPDSGAALQWNGLNQLQSVVTVTRRNSPNDRESYSYGQGLRLRKTTLTQQGNIEQRQDTLYLPGLELRRTTKGSQSVEQLEVLTVGEAGRSQVRLLNWVSGKPADIANGQLRYSLDDLLGSSTLELDQSADILTLESYYPYGGTAVRGAKTQSEAKAKTVRYSGKERDSTGLYYYGYRYYQPWLGRWLNPDPAGTVDGLNLFSMVRNNPVTFWDAQGKALGDRDMITWNMQGSGGDMKMQTIKKWIDSSTRDFVISLQEAGATKEHWKETRVPLKAPPRWEGEYSSATFETTQRNAFIYHLKTDSSRTSRVNLAIVTTEKADRVIILRPPDIVSPTGRISAGSVRPILGVKMGDDFYFNIHASAQSRSGQGKAGWDVPHLIQTVAEYMARENPAADWTVMGDFNREPLTVTQNLKDADIDDFTVVSQTRKTHQSGRTLDFAVMGGQASDNNQNIQATLDTQQWGTSDHTPVFFKIPQQQNMGADKRTLRNPGIIRSAIRKRPK